MRVIEADELARLLDYPRLIAAIRAGFSGSVIAPSRHHHAIPRAGGSPATLILMPAWQEDGAGAYAGGIEREGLGTFPDLHGDAFARDDAVVHEDMRHAGREIEERAVGENGAILQMKEDLRTALMGREERYDTEAAALVRRREAAE